MRYLSILLCLVIGFSIASCDRSKRHRNLEVFGPKTLNHNGDTIYHTIGDFELTNHLGETVSRSDFDNRIYVANFFFATCPEICPKMQGQLKRVQDAYNKSTKIKFISHTVDPAKDTVEALAAYAAKLDFTDSEWDLVTGIKKEIYDLARYDYYVSASEGDGGKSDFIHSDKLVLIDKQGRIRGYYLGLDSNEVDKLIKDIWLLASQEKREI